MSEREDRTRKQGSAMEAVIVAGGFGTRLLPLTTHRPKHLLEVAGVPFLEHQITRLADAGVDHVVLATSYHADLFEPVLGDGSNYGVRLTYVQESEPLGTAGAIRNVASALEAGPDDPVVILNGDIVSGHDLAAQLADFEREREGCQVQVSLHLVEVSDARAFGCVPTDDEGRVMDFVEKSETPVTNQINAGCYLFRRKVIDQIPAGRVVSVERETFPALVADGAVVVGYVESAYWRDVGTPQALVLASKELVKGVGRSPAVEPQDGGVLIDPTAFVARDALVTDGSALSAGARVDTGAIVRGSVLMAGAEVGLGASVVDSVVGPGAIVGPRVRLESATIGDGAHVSESLEPGTRVGCA